MNEIKATFSPEIKDYRAAVYFSAVFAHYKLLMIFVAVAFTSVACLLSYWVGFMPKFMLPLYLTMGYVIWLLFIAGNLELGIYKYSKREDCILYKEMSVTFAKEKIVISTPYNRKTDTVRLDKLFYAAELKNIFVIYLDTQHSILIPCRALTPAERAEVRSILMDSLKGNFATRYGYNGMLPKRSPLRK